MGERSQYPPGTFCWIHLATGDLEGARAFYADLFGWSFPDATCALVGECRVAGVGAPGAARPPAPHWLSFVSVADVDETTRRAADLGGQVLAEPAQSGAGGRTAILRDLDEALVALWQPAPAIGAERVNEHGTLCWNELTTRDPDRAAGFYTGLFGWTTEPFGDNYTIFLNGDRFAAGMMRIDEQETPPAQPEWVVYFAVDDCDAIHERGLSLGGRSLMPPADYPDVGRGALQADPQGAAFATIHLLNPPD